MGRVLGLLFVAAGCGGGRNLAGDQDAVDGSTDVESVEDIADAAVEDAVPDVPSEDAATADDGDGGLPGPSCPEALAGDGPVRFTVRWRQVAPWAWASPGSTAFGVIGGVLMAVQPSSPWVGGSEPFNVWLDAETGEVLPYERDRAVVGARVVLMRDDGDRFDVGGFPPGYGLVATDPEGTEWTPDGRQFGGWGRGAEAMGLEILVAQSARLVPARIDPVGLIEGQALGGEWGVDAGVLWGGELFPLYRGAELSGDPFVALGRTSVATRWLWTVGDELVLTDDAGVEMRRAPLGWGAAYVPAAAARSDLVGSDFLIAGRGPATASGTVMRVERRGLEDLSVVSAHELAAYESLVDRPEPRDLAGDNGTLALAWVAERRAGDEARSLCLYLTPLDEEGAPAGSAVRLDEGLLPVDGMPVENVRVIVREGSFFVLWQRQPDMWLARVDHAS